MRKHLFQIMLLFSIAACKNKAEEEEPMWINKTDMVSFPKDSLIFKAKGDNWKASLFSFTQPVPLKMEFTKNGFILFPRNRYGITEGTAQLMLRNGSQKIYYQFSLRNNSFGSVSEKDYRSPKTVNPDSGLVQHRMLHTMDEWRNILNAPQQLKPFYEEIIKLRPTAGTYRAQKNNLLSTYYVQPGSATSIQVKSIYNKEENVFAVTAGPLKDKHYNTVSNGTIVAFIYRDDEQTYRMEATLLNGVACAKIPAEKNKRYRLIAKVNETVSDEITLQP